MKYIIKSSIQRVMHYKDSSVHGNDFDMSTGTYLTEKERKAGKFSGHHSKIYGLYSEEQPNRTVSMMVSWRDGASVTGWVGEYSGRGTVLRVEVKK